METINLSEAAQALLRLHLDGGTLQVGAKDPESLPGHTVEQTRVAYRELVEAGLMIALHSFLHGRDSRYRLTMAGVNARASLSESASSRR